ncbi:MAG: PorT family protein [Candidatus Cloacimonetes bacterium]|nr:PorT family protein [Candidatus Cloacimonadota bacterium]
MKISRTVLFITLIASLCTSLFAIEIDEKGIKLGINYTRLFGNATENTDFTPGFSIGAFINKRVNNWLVIQPELLLSSKLVYRDGEERFYLDNDADGSFDEDEYDLIDNDGDGLIDEDRSELYFQTKGHYQLYYLEIPILFKTITQKSSSNRINLIFGPSFNFLLKDEYKFTNNGNEFHSSDMSGTDTFNLEVMCGIEYKIGKYVIELRLDQGVTKNNYKSAGEVMMDSFESYEEIFGPSVGDDYSDYCRYQKVSGYNTSVTLLLNIFF